MPPYQRRMKEKRFFVLKNYLQKILKFFEDPLLILFFDKAFVEAAFLVEEVLAAATVALTKVVVELLGSSYHHSVE